MRYIKKIILEFSIEGNLCHSKYENSFTVIPFQGNILFLTTEKYHADCSWLNPGARGEHFNSQLSWVAA